MNQTLSYYSKKELQIVVIADTRFPDVSPPTSFPAPAPTSSPDSSYPPISPTPAPLVRFSHFYLLIFAFLTPSFRSLLPLLLLFSLVSFSRFSLLIFAFLTLSSVPPISSSPPLLLLFSSLLIFAFLPLFVVSRLHLL